MTNILKTNDLFNMFDLTTRDLKFTNRALNGFMEIPILFSILLRGFTNFIIYNTSYYASCVYSYVYARYFVMPEIMAGLNAGKTRLPTLESIEKKIQDWHDNPKTLNHLIYLICVKKLVLEKLEEESRHKALYEHETSNVVETSLEESTFEQPVIDELTSLYGKHVGVEKFEGEILDVQNGNTHEYRLVHSFSINVVRHALDVNLPLHNERVVPETVIKPYINFFCSSSVEPSQQTRVLLEFLQETLDNMTDVEVFDVTIERTTCYIHSITINVVPAFEFKNCDDMSYTRHIIKPSKLTAYQPCEDESALSLSSQNLRDTLQEYLKTQVTQDEQFTILKNHDNVEIITEQLNDISAIEARIERLEVQNGTMMAFQAFSLVVDAIMTLYKIYAMVLICRTLLKMTPVFDFFVTKYNSCLEYINKKVDFCLKIVNFDYQSRIGMFCETVNLTTIIVRMANMDAETRNRLVELKAMCHVLYHLYSGNILSAQEHLSYTFVTRPIDLSVLLLNGGLAAYHLVDQVKYSKIKVDDQYITVTADEYQRLCAEADKGKRITPEDVVHILDPQAGNLDDVAACIGTLFGNWQLTNLQVKDIELANKQFAFLKNVRNDVSEKTKLITFLLRLALRTRCSFDPLDPEYQIYSDDLVECIKKIDAVLARQDILFSDVDEMNNILVLHDEAFKLYTHVRMASVSGCLQRAFAKSYSEIHTLYLATKQALQGNKSRIEPVCVLLMGKPGSGKSRFIEYAMEEIGAIQGKPFSPEQAYYMSTSPYWERYCRQEHVIGDDIFKSTDSKILFVEAEKIIHMQNTAPYNLDMAFTGKGTNYFDSSFIWLTTNYGKGGSFKGNDFKVGVIDPDALKRRFTLVLERNEASKANVEENTYYIAKCDPFPFEVGHVRDANYIVQLVMRLRELHKQRFIGSQRDYDDIRRRYDVPHIHEDDLIHDQFVEQNGESPRKPPELSEWLLKIMPMHILEWTNSPNAQWYAFAAACVVGILTVPSIYNYFFGTTGFETHSPRDKQYQGDQVYYGKPRSLNFMHPTENFGYSTVPQPVVNFGAQNGDLDFHACLRNTVANGVGLIEIVANDSKRSYSEYSQCFHVKDGIMITPAHSLLKYTANDMQVASCILHIAGKTYEMEFPTKYFRVEGEDAFIFILPKTIPRPISLYKYLIEGSKYVEILPTQEVYQIWIGFNGEVSIRTMNRIPWSGRVSYEICGELLIMETKCAYYGDCKKGDSGSPAIVHTKDGPRIVGMHVGVTTSGSKVGVATLLCKEWIDQLSNSMTTQSANRIVLKVERLVDLTVANNLPFRTRLRRSPIYGWIGSPKSIPARFTPFVNSKGIEVDPLTIAMAKLKQEHFINPEYICEERVIEYLMSVYPPPSDPRVLTFEEALNGIPGRNMPSIVGSTSAGYPYSLHSKKGKAPYITLVQGRYVYQEEFLESLVVFEQHILAGEQIEVIWADTLKDETRPVEKVDEGKTRLFTSCPLHYLILVRKYMLDFVTHVQSLAASHPISVGLDVHSLSWTRLYMRMSRFNGSIIAGDFKNYDGSIPAFIGHIVLKFINKWYGGNEIESRARALLFEHLWCGVRICGQSIYYTKDGNPSGNPITSIYNSLVNMVMCYIILTCDFNLLESEFDFVMYGDDNIISVARQGLRCSDFSPHFKRRFNMEYTHFSKVTGADPVDTMDTIRYLGRSFVRELTIYRAPLELTTILEATYWVRGTDVNNAAFMSTVASAFLELSHFPIDEFNIHTNSILRAIKNAGLVAEHDYLQSRRKTWYDYHDSMYDHNKKIVYTMRSQYKGNMSHDGTFHCQGNKFKPSVEKIDDSIGSQFMYEVEEFEFECHSGGAQQTPKLFGEVTETRNVQFTERAANEAPQSQAVQLGQYDDVAPVGHGAVGDVILQQPAQDCNMETFTLDYSLNREYLLENITWSVSSASSAVIGGFNFPQALFEQDYIAQKIDNFRYFRAGIRFTVRIVSNKFLYGRLMIVYTPQPATIEVVPSNILVWSGYPHMLVSASAGEAAVFDVPFIYPRRALDLLETMTNQMGIFRIIVVNPLVDISGTISTANIMVTAQFLDANVFMPHADATGFVLHSGKGAESRLKSKEHSLSSVYNVSKTLASGIKSAAIVASYGSTAIKLARPAATMMMTGLSKPRTMNMTNVMKVNPFSDLNTGEGIDLTPTLGMDPENQISTTPNVMGIDVDEMNFKQLCGTPVMTSLHSLGPGTASLAIDSVSMTASGSFAGGNYAEWLISMFDYVSGSKKVKIYFTASQFHSARVVLYLADSNGTVDWQNCYHRIVDIQGDTETSFTLPYTSSYVSGGSLGETNQFGLFVTVLSWSQPENALNTPIYMVTYTSAASDFQVAGLKDVKFVVQSCPREDFAQAFEPFHPSMTGYSHTGLLFGEEYTTVRQIIHRYSAITDTATMPTPYVIDAWQGQGDMATGQYIGPETLGLVYQFWRGSKRIKVITKSQTPQSLFVVGGLSNRLKGTAISSLANPLLEIELPYYDNRLFLQTKDNTTYRVYAGAANNNMFVLTACGDDFSFHFIRPPPPGDFTTNAAGFQTMKTFLET